MGCVPVALSTNRFAIGLDEASGAIVVDEVAQLAPAIPRCSEQPERLRRLSERGPAQARHEADWGSYLERVRSFSDRERPRRLAPRRLPQSGRCCSLRKRRGREADRRGWKNSPPNWPGLAKTVTDCMLCPLSSQPSESARSPSAINSRPP